tara:strand:- start:1948 stop:2280 length:333 start_codon:yes stop_codon:yes gene_type:complete
MKYLEGVLDEIFGQQSSHEKDLIVEAVNKDNKEGIKVTGKVTEILPMINRIFEKKFRIMSPKVIKRYKQLLKTYSLEDMERHSPMLKITTITWSLIISTALLNISQDPNR